MNKTSIKFYLFLILVALPIDWFSPTGQLFREAGAKPANIIISMLGIIFLIRGRNIFSTKHRFNAQTYFGIILYFGTFAFLVNITFFTNMNNGGRTPLFQYASQALMILMFMFVLQSLTYLFKNRSLRDYAAKMLPVSALVHLTFFLIEYFFGHTTFVNEILSVFRNESGLIDRPSGLMSEPSYYGVFAALYGLPLIMIYGARSLLFIVLGIALLITAYMVNAKTMFMVLALQLMFLFFVKKMPYHMRTSYFIIVATSLPAALMLATSTAAFNFDDNLSSVMRVGSSITALNAALDGYGLIGSGIGQFHFLYKPEYAPDFLFYSTEGVIQLYGESENRASSFNYPLRILVEIGTIGLVIIFLLAVKSIRTVCSSKDSVSLVGLSFIGGSFGFLMTQDTYCLPSLAFGLALVLTDRNCEENHTRYE
jgi:hypothetical protein